MGCVETTFEWFMDSVLSKEAEERWSCWCCWMDGWWFFWKWHGGQNGNGQDAVCEWRNHWMIESTAINQSITQSISQSTNQSTNHSINQSFTQSDWMFTNFLLSLFAGTTKVSTTWRLGMKNVRFASCGSQSLHLSSASTLQGGSNPGDSPWLT